MRSQTALMLGSLLLFGSDAFAYVPGKTPAGANRHWSSGTISIQLTGPTVIDGHAVHDAVRNAMASWNAVAHARIGLTALATVDRAEPSIGNGKNEFGWVERSDNPYFIPGVPCTTAYIYDTVTGVMDEADSTCNAMAYQWPSALIGLYTEDNVVDAESAALQAFGAWLGLDASLEYGDPMYPDTGSGIVKRTLSSDDFSFGRHQYGDGTSSNGSIGGVIRHPDGSPVPYAYVVAFDPSGTNAYGAVAEVDGSYTIFEPVAGTYSVVARPMTTDPSIVSSVRYRENPIGNLDFTPEFYGGGVEVRNGAATTGVDITAMRSGSQPDAYEPDDASGAASALTPGAWKIAGMHAPLDVDWYWFQTAANTCFVVTTALQGASIVPTRPGEPFWSRTRVSLYDGDIIVGRNESKDDYQRDPSNWITYCEAGLGRRMNLAIEQREVVGGPGFFYAVSVRTVAGGFTRTPVIFGLNPSSGFSHRNRFVRIDGADFMPGAAVEIRLPGATWVAASQVIATQCDADNRCASLKALFPTATPGSADVRVTNPNGLSATKISAFTYLATGDGPLADRTLPAFGTRYGQGKAVCIGDYDGDGSDDILKTRNNSLSYQLFRNNRGGTFTDVAAAAGLHLYSSVWGNSCSLIDIDDDGDLDAYITNVAYSLPAGSANELYENHLMDSGSATFTLATPGGLNGSPLRYKSDAAWADFDKDGRLDVVLTYDSYAGSAPYEQAVQFFRQNGNGSFTDATNTSGLWGYVASITSVKAADFDNDGCDDLVFFTHAGLANRLYKGNCRGQFTDITSSTRIAEGSPWCTGVTIADFNNDGSADIFCGTYNAGAAPIRPRLWLNNGSATFTDHAAEAGLHAVARNMDVVLTLDEDNDGLTDVYVGASENGWIDDRKDVLLRNTGGNPPLFVDATDAAEMYPTTQDGSGYCAVGVGEFYCDRDASAGGVFDWNNDGALDVFVTGDDPDFLSRGADFLWNNKRDVLADGSVAAASDWIDVALRGGNTPTSRILSNRLGIGARVTVVPRFNLAGDAVPTEAQCLQHVLPAGVIGYAKEVLAGNQSQSSTVLHFGLGSSLPFGRKRVDCIRVEWPSGFERAYTGLTADTKVVLAEDAGRMKIVKVVPNSGPNTRSDPTTIVGLRFDRDLPAAPQVFFGSVPALSVEFVSEHELTVRPPLWQTPGSVDVTVVNTDGERDTLLAAYTFTGSSVYVRFKDPVPSMLTINGSVSNDPDYVAGRGTERSGVVADGITELIFEAEVAGPGQVRFVLDEDDDPSNAPSSATSVGTISGLSGGAPGTSVTVAVNRVADGRYLGHGLFTAPQDFIRTAADASLSTRAIRVRTYFIDAANQEHALPPRSLDLYRVPVLYVHGMWGDPTAFGWPVANDSRWIVHRADYGATNDVSFAENAGMPPRVVAELKKEINDRGIAGTRFFVFAHSMGAVLFKIFMAGAGAPYARADNFFAGDVYALVPVDAPFFGSPLASLLRKAASLRWLGEDFISWMYSHGLDTAHGSVTSLDPASPDIRGIPSTTGTFHAITGWGGREMRESGAEIAEAGQLPALEGALRMFNYALDSYLLPCSDGDDLVVCTDSQQGGLVGGAVDDFHYIDQASKAIHFGSICKELGPSLAAERLLDTPTTNASVWGHVLPKAPPLATSELSESRARTRSVNPLATTGGDGLSLTVARQEDDILLSFSGAATRLLKSSARSLAAGVCLAVSGAGYVDARQLTVPTSAYYEAGSDSLCAPEGSPSVASVTPPSGSAMGGYAITILGSAFVAGTKVRVGDFFATDVTVVNATTITCRMIPGDPGPALITVIDPSGRTASLPFTYTDPEPASGGVAITSPGQGAVVTAGSTITVSAVGFSGFTIAKALITADKFSSDEDQDPGPGFSARVPIPVDALGPVTIQLLARDANSNIKIAPPLTVSAVPPGNVTLLRLDAEKVTLLHGTPTRQLRVYGVYSDGIRREVTRAAGIQYEMDAPDPRKPGYPYNGTGVAVVDAAGVVTAKTHGSAICHISYAGSRVDVVVEVAAIRPTVTLQKPGFVSWPFQGPGITYDVVRGKLSALRATGGNFADVTVGTTCLKDNFANVTAADVANPPIAEGFFYLLKESLTRSYEESPFWATRSQAGIRTTEIAAAPNTCSQAP